ncbi:MAG: 1-deoxy-D-xylulose-5-phosphate synthase [Spirochaetes bacterium]|nr:1-deoxy-D-xylulose-5-phosphate synthase [Spirochaetota bacterium]
MLESISSPEDIRSLSVRELYRLAAEIRLRIIEVVTRNGGHLASNLGVVELTLALHRVFVTPRDAIVWDVGHQCYAHKLITGRSAEFDAVRRKGGPSGFPKRSESEHDAFDTGHASTSISAALGILEAMRARGGKGRAVAVIGDGSLTGGMAFEALSHAGQLGIPLVVVLNDNKMSISANVGALSRYLSRLTASVPYQTIRRRIDSLIAALPVGRIRLQRFAYAFKRSLKGLFFKENLFSDLGFEYVGPIDGHNIQVMTSVLREALRIEKPVVVHVVTKKGKGHELAEEDPTRYHGVTPLAVTDGKVGAKCPATFTEAFSDAMMKAGRRDGRIVAVTAAMVKGTGLASFQAQWPKRCFDVGIAEEHAVTFAAGMAAGGLKPVVAIYSTFMQRAVDQVFHDVCLQDLPVVFALDRAGAVPDDGETHQGLYDIPVFRSMPDLAILAPASAAEIDAALNWALDSGAPAMIRYPKASCPPEREAFGKPFETGRGVFVERSGGELLVVASGGLVDNAREATITLARNGIMADLYHLRFLKPIDEAWFMKIAAPYRAILFLEEGVVTGGIGEALSRLILLATPGIRVAVAGFPERPPGQASRDELLEAAGLSARGISVRLLELAGLPVLPTAVF